MDSLEDRVAGLEERLAQLERHLRRGPEDEIGDGAGRDDPGDRAARREIRRAVRRAGTAHAGEPDAPEGVSGMITYGGAARFEDHDYQWISETTVPDLLRDDWARSVKALECLGSPARLALLAALLGPPRSRQELQEVLGDTSTGHLYHHLKDLHAAGLLERRRRGEYEIPPRAVVPLLTIIAAALDLNPRIDAPAARTDAPESEEE